MQSVVARPRDNARAMREAGVNRLSIGVQALDEHAAALPRPPARRERRAARDRRRAAASCDARERGPDLRPAGASAGRGGGAGALARLARARAPVGLRADDRAQHAVRQAARKGAPAARASTTTWPRPSSASRRVLGEQRPRALRSLELRASPASARATTSTTGAAAPTSGSARAPSAACTPAAAPRTHRARAGYRNDPNPERYMAQQCRARASRSSEEALAADDLMRERLMLGLRTSDGCRPRQRARRARHRSARGPRAARSTRALARDEVVLEATCCACRASAGCSSTRSWRGCSRAL